MAGTSIDRIGRSNHSSSGRSGTTLANNTLIVVTLILIVTTTLINSEELHKDHTNNPMPNRSTTADTIDIDNIVKEEIEDKLADLDRVLQSSAFRSFGHPVITGRIYNVTVANASLGSRVTVKTVRLKVGSLVHRGFTLEEFTIPTRAGPIGVARIVLVYRRFVARLYEPSDLIIVSPVLGIKVYDAANLSRTDAPELDFVSRASDNVTVRIPVSRTEVTGVPQCAEFDRFGNVSLSSVTNPTAAGAAAYGCSSRSLGDFALVVAAGSIPPATGPAAAPLPLSSTPPPPPPPPSRPRRRRSRKWRIIVGGVVGGVAGLVLLGLIVAAAMRYRRKSRISQMEQHSDRGEMLQTSLIGGSRAPTAGASRTKPVLESDYAAAA